MTKQVFPHEEVSPKSFTIGAMARTSEPQPQRSDGRRALRSAAATQHNRSETAAVDGDADVTGQEICGLDRNQ